MVYRYLKWQIKHLQVGRSSIDCHIKDCSRTSNAHGAQVMGIIFVRGMSFNRSVRGGSEDSASRAIFRSFYEPVGHSFFMPAVRLDQGVGAVLGEGTMCNLLDSEALALLNRRRNDSGR